MIGSDNEERTQRNESRHSKSAKLARISTNMVLVNFIASQCHEMNRRYCAAIGDLSHRPWPDATEAHRASARAGVIFRLNNPFSTPEDQHEQWLRDKSEQGWKYGSIKDEHAKLHPCMVPYCELSIEQRAKDALFVATVFQTIEALQFAQGLALSAVTGTIN
jgi:hypothetical protein